MSVTLGQAETMIEAALAKAAELKLKPLGVAVLDTGGHLIAVRRQDGCAPFRPEIAVAKAAGALALGMSSRAIAETAAARPAFVASLSAIAGRGIVPSPGGVIIVNDAGAPIGAVAVSGDTADNDEACALAGIAGAGLKAQT